MFYSPLYWRIQKRQLYLSDLKDFETLQTLLQNYSIKYLSKKYRTWSLKTFLSYPWIRLGCLNLNYFQQYLIIILIILSIGRYRFRVKWKTNIGNKCKLWCPWNCSFSFCRNWKFFKSSSGSSYLEQNFWLRV